MKECLTYLENRNLGTTNQILPGKANWSQMNIQVTIIIKCNIIKINELSIPLKNPGRVTK